MDQMEKMETQILKTNKFWNMSRDGRIEIIGPIVRDESSLVSPITGEKIPGFSVEAFNNDLKELESVNELNIVIDSQGGDVMAAISIYNALLSYPGKKRVTVTGAACSSASLIMCAGDEINVHDSSMIMIHAVKSRPTDFMTTEELRQVAESNEFLNRTVAEIYARKTGKSTEDCLNAMREETWLTGKEAIDFGLCDYLINTNRTEEFINQHRTEVMNMATNLDEKIKEIQEELAKENQTPETPAKDETPAEEKPEEQDKGEENVDKEKEQAVETPATESENLADLHRIMMIDKFAHQANLDADFVHKAKYVDRLNYTEFLEKALIEKSKSSVNADFVNDLAAETQVGYLPPDRANKAPENPKEARKNYLDSIAKLVNEQGGFE